MQAARRTRTAQPALRPPADIVLPFRAHTWASLVPAVHSLGGSVGRMLLTGPCTSWLCSWVLPQIWKGTPPQTSPSPPDSNICKACCLRKPRLRNEFVPASYECFPGLGGAEEARTKILEWSPSPEPGGAGAGLLQCPHSSSGPRGLPTDQEWTQRGLLRLGEGRK